MSLCTDAAAAAAEEDSVSEDEQQAQLLEASRVTQSHNLLNGTVRANYKKHSSGTNTNTSVTPAHDHTNSNSSNDPSHTNGGLQLTAKVLM